MKQINNIKSEVFLSTYDNSDILLPVSEEHKGVKNICVAVKFGDIIIKISPKTTCKCTWDEAMEKHKEGLMSPAFWQMVGNVYHKVNQALKMLNHEPLGWVWTDSEDNNPEYSSYRAWIYSGYIGRVGALIKFDSLPLRATLAFQF